MSDSNYKKVELNGPSIDQIVHPLAAAEFVNAGPGARSKRMVNSCSGNMVDVEVDLRVSQKILWIRVFADIVIREPDRGTWKCK